jgi:hypothetical protein
MIAWKSYFKQTSYIYTILAIIIVIPTTIIFGYETVRGGIDNKIVDIKGLDTYSLFFINSSLLMTISVFTLLGLIRRVTNRYIMSKAAILDTYQDVYPTFYDPPSPPPHSPVLLR